MTKLILIRHGETSKNVEGKLHRDKDEEELNEKGKSQMKITSLALKQYCPSIIYASREKRAQESAKIIAETLNLSVKTIDGLQERNWGDLSGKSWSEIRVILDPMTLDERYNYVPPNGESWKEFEIRLKNAINQVLSHNEGKNIVIVSHGGSIGALMPYLLGAPREESFKYDPASASITVFNYDGSVFIQEKVDDTSHLVDIE